MASSSEVRPSRRGNIITEDDVQSAPLNAANKELIVNHVRRLLKVVAGPELDRAGNYTGRQAAKEQLVRLTLTLNEYKAMHTRGEIGDAVEFLVADMVDASLFLVDKEGIYTAVSANIASSSQHERYAELMRELDNVDVDKEVKQQVLPRMNKKALLESDQGKKRDHFDGSKTESRRHS